MLEDRVTGGQATAEGQAFMEDRAGLKGWQEFAGIRVFCWRMQAAYLLLCVRLVELCVHVLVCNWQRGLIWGGVHVPQTLILLCVNVYVLCSCYFVCSRRANFCYS